MYVHVSMQAFGCDARLSQSYTHSLCAARHTCKRTLPGYHKINAPYVLLQLNMSWSPMILLNNAATIVLKAPCKAPERTPCLLYSSRRLARRLETNS